MSDPHEALDSFKIAQLLGSFLRAKPHDTPVHLAGWQVEQLLAMAQTPFTGQPSLLDAVGSLYCLCFYCGTAPLFEDDKLLVASTLLLQTVAAECLYVLQLGVRDGAVRDSVRAVHPSEALLRHNLRTLPSTALYDVLYDAFDLARAIVRDIKDQIRTAHEPTMQKKDDYKDGFYAHSIYLMCCFGLAHVAATLKANNHLGAVPGMSETLLLMTLSAYVEDLPAEPTDLTAASQSDASTPYNPLLPRPGGSVAAAAKSQKSKKGGKFVPVFVEDTRLGRCMETAARLGTALVLYSFDERTLQEVKLVRTRMARRLVHPDVTYAHDRAMAFGRFLADNDIRGGGAGAAEATKRGAEESIASPPAAPVPACTYRTGHLLSIGGRPYDPAAFERPDWAESQKAAPAPVAIVVPDWLNMSAKLMREASSAGTDGGTFTDEEGSPGAGQVASVVTFDGVSTASPELTADGRSSVRGQSPSSTVSKAKKGWASVAASVCSFSSSDALIFGDTNL